MSTLSNDIVYLGLGGNVAEWSPMLRSRLPYLRQAGKRSGDSRFRAVGLEI